MSGLFLRSELLHRQGVRHAFSTRAGGVSAAPFDTLNLGKSVGDDPAAVEENLSRFLMAAGIERSTLSTVNQVHGHRVVFAPSGSDVLQDESDATIEDRVDADAIVAAPGRAAGVRTADCIPILLHDQRSGAVGAVHAGWRGTVAYVLVEALEAMHRRHGTRPKDIVTAIGPGIGSCCFFVGAEVADRFASHGLLRQTVEQDPDGRLRVNLARANWKLLTALGVPPEQIDVLDLCTSCRRDLFFSHRRDGGRTGRHLAIIAAGESAPSA